MMKLMWAINPDCQPFRRTLSRVAVHTVAGFQYPLPVAAVVEFPSTASWRNLELEDFISGRPPSNSVSG